MKKAIGCFLLGAAVGGIAVALTTPKTGKEARDGLKSAGEAGLEKVKDLELSAHIDLENGMESLKGRLAGLESSVKDVLHTHIKYLGTLPVAELEDDSHLDEAAGPLENPIILN